MKQFKDLISLIDWVSSELKTTELFSDSITFIGDISRAKLSTSKDLFIEVSQRLGTGKTYKINIFLSRYYVKTLLENLELKDVSDLENKSWKIVGRLSFWPSSSNIAITLKSLSPVGESKLEKRRRVILNKLKLEGLLRTANNTLEMLPPIKKIAVISSETAAGYGDFVKNINKTKYPPLIHLYPSPMQGVEVPVGIISALKNILKSKIDYDLVVIIRGGGSQADLMYFDDFNLAQHIAYFSNNKIPIVTGIGHEQDTTILDFVSYIRFSTPTEVARAINNQIEFFHQTLHEKFQNIIYEINSNFTTTEIKLKNLSENLSIYFNNITKNQEKYLKEMSNKINNINKFFEMNEKALNSRLDFINLISNHINNKLINFSSVINNEKNLIQKNMENKLNMSFQRIDELYIKITQNSPFSAFLSNGAIVIQNGEIVNTIKNLKIDPVEIKFKDGEAKGKIESINYYNNIGGEKNDNR
ncbi:exodeoxyribonuclease VII large subunit [Marinitoga sp. 1138]|uniref:exodeoxyribonuclease VII large subunit n=1 Tax=Marinitoga sp. 1138 TaxID=1643334 RepID=UPI00158692F6|nr:exodeoxyribonuclease VII large subunit [Marinitoga sp. 1138]NUU97007.1 hypothetical protein [Marinitoga sp. 1138]